MLCVSSPPPGSRKQEGFIFLVIDFVSIFDHEDKFDCLETLDKIKVNKKAKRLWYLLNKDTQIQVKTAHGMTEEEHVGDCLGQGTAGAGLISAANLDQGLQKYFNETEPENESTGEDVTKFGNMRLQPIAYQDDVGSVCANIEMARSQAKKLTKLTFEKVLEAHPDKSGLVILANDKFRQKTKEELSKNPIYLTNFKLNVMDNTKYLGQNIESNLAISTLETVKSRAGKIKGAAMEVKAIIEAFEMKAIGGLAAAWELWEKALLPSLLSGAGTWLGKNYETVKLCNQIQKNYWRLMFNVPESCPKLALLCENNQVDMKFRIYNEKCQLLVQIQRLETEALARRIYEQAEEHDWPGLGRDVRAICEEILIPDINKYNIDKKEIRSAIYEAHYDNMMKLFDQSKKLQDIKNDNFRSYQSYFHDKNLSNARLKFKICAKMVENVPGNF